MTEIKNNLFGIKWPTGVDMPLNKTQTQTPLSTTQLVWFVEYADCIFAEDNPTPPTIVLHMILNYQVMSLQSWGSWSIAPFRPRVIVSDWISSMGQIELFNSMQTNDWC